MTNETLTYDYWCSQLVTLSCEAGDRVRDPVSGNLEEIGESTALVLAEDPVRRGTRVRISCESGQLQGIVDSCTHHHVLGYFVRLQLAQESRWTKEQFAPKHLLAVPKQRSKAHKGGVAA